MGKNVVEKDKNKINEEEELLNAFSLDGAPEPEYDDLVSEDDLTDEDLEITAENVDQFSDDSVRLYLREIGKIPLLSNEEEVDLAYRIVKGEKKAKDKAEKVLSDESRSKSDVERAKIALSKAINRIGVSKHRR